MPESKCLKNGSRAPRNESRAWEAISQKELKLKKLKRQYHKVDSCASQSCGCTYMTSDKYGGCALCCDLLHIKDDITSVTFGPDL